MVFGEFEDRAEAIDSSTDGGAFIITAKIVHIHCHGICAGRYRHYTVFKAPGLVLIKVRPVRPDGISGKGAIKFGENIINHVILLVGKQT